MNDNFKYWLYYLTETGELYAYTDKKELSIIFEEDRNMHKFKKEKRYLTKELVNYLAREHQNKYLKEEILRIYSNIGKKWFNGKIVMTIDESLTVNNMNIQLQEEIYKNCWIDPIIFKKELYNALSLLGFTYFWNQINSTYSETMDIEPCPIDIDNLALFIKYYGKTLKG